MNKREFYRQLMEENVCDPEKIKQAVRSGRGRRRYTPPLKWVSMAGSVAVLTVAFGFLAVKFFGNLPDGDGIVISGVSSSDISGFSVKLPSADSAEIVNVMVSFSSPLTLQQIENMTLRLSENTDPPIMVALFDGNGRVECSGGELPDGGLPDGAVYNGVIYSGVENVFLTLETDNSVLCVEVLDNDSISLALPKTIDDFKNTETDAAYTSEDSKETADSEKTYGESDDNVGGNDDNNADNNDTANNSDKTSETTTGTTLTNPEVSSNPTGPDDPYNDDPVEKEQTSKPAETEPPATTQPETPPVTEIPVTEPPVPVINDIKISVNGAVSAYFINDTKLIAILENGIEIYDAENPNQPYLQVTGGSPKINYMSPDKSKIIASLCDNSGYRTMIWAVNIAENTSNLLDISAFGINSSFGELLSVAYNEASDTLVLRSINHSSGNSVTQITCSGIDFKSCLATASKIVYESAGNEGLMLLAMSGRNLYYAKIYDTGRTEICKKDIDTLADSVIRTYENTPKISRNLSFNCAAVSPADNEPIGFTELFIAESETFMSTGYISEVYFSLNGKYCNSGGVYYMIANGTAVQVSELEAADKIDYKNNMSGKYYISGLSSELITITERGGSDSEYGEVIIDTQNGDAEESEETAETIETIEIAKSE